MKKNIAIILSLLLFSGCSQPAAEVSSSPAADVTATSTIEISSEATSTPEATQNSPTPITNTPLPTPFFDFQYSNLQDIFNYHFESKNNAVLKTPEDFDTEEELYNFIFEECMRRHNGVSQPDALYLHITLTGEWLPSELEGKVIMMDVVLTNKELIDEWLSFVKTVKLKKNEKYLYDSKDHFFTGVGPSITYCYKLGPDIIELYKDNFKYYYPNETPYHYPVTVPDWNERTKNLYTQFENKIYQLAADKFKAAYEQAANYPFLN